MRLLVRDLSLAVTFGAILGWQLWWLKVRRRITAAPTPDSPSAAAASTTQTTARLLPSLIQDEMKFGPAVPYFEYVATGGASTLYGSTPVPVVRQPPSILARPGSLSYVAPEPMYAESPSPASPRLHIEPVMMRAPMAPLDDPPEKWPPADARIPG